MPRIAGLEPVVDLDGDVVGHVLGARADLEARRLSCFEPSLRGEVRYCWEIGAG